MGQIVVTEFVSLDGVFEDPGDAEGFARAWPSVTDTVGFADKMNGMPKYVVSSTLTDPAWNNSAVIGLGDYPP